MALRSYSHLRDVFDEYKKVAKRDIEQAIMKEMSGDIGAGMLTVGMCMYVLVGSCLLYTSPSPRDATLSRMPSSA